MLIAPDLAVGAGRVVPPEVEVDGEVTRVPVERMGAVDTTRLADLVGLLGPQEIWVSMRRCYQPRARHSGTEGRSAPRVVSSPWPG